MSEEKVLTKEIATQFLVDEGSVELKEFTSLEDDDVATLLSKAEKDLFLNGLTELSGAVAESLSKCKGDLSLDDLTELSDADLQSVNSFFPSPYDCFSVFRCNMLAIQRHPLC